RSPAVGTETAARSAEPPEVPAERCARQRLRWVVEAPCMPAVAVARLPEVAQQAVAAQVAHRQVEPRGELVALHSALAVAAAPSWGLAVAVAEKRPCPAGADEVATSSRLA